MSVEERFQTITYQLEEVIGAEEIRKLLAKGTDPKIYWGTATTGKPHFGYFVPMLKIADYLKAGCHVTILFADLHAYLDNMKSNWELLEKRCRWYELVIKEMLKLVQVPLEKLTFIKGTDYQLSREYTLDVYKMSALVTTEMTTKAGAEVVKQTDHPLMSNLLYPILQALDEEYLKVDIQFGGLDQRKIFMFARENLPRIGYRKRCHLMNPLIPGLGKSGKMSSSEPDSKIDFDDSPKEIDKKISKAFSVDGQADGNGLLSILKYVLFRYLQLKGRPFEVERTAEHGGNISFNTFDEVYAAFRDGELRSNNLKPAISKLICEFIKPLQDVILQNQALMAEAYPPPVVVSGINMSWADIRVGKVLSVENHPSAETLYIEKIDLGEEAPRTVVSGLAKAVSKEELLGRLVPVVCNLGTATIKDVASNGMVLVAQNADKALSLVEIPEGVKPGSKITAPPYVGEVDPTISKNRWGKVAKAFAIVNGVCQFRGVNMVTENGAALLSSFESGTLA